MNRLPWAAILPLALAACATRAPAPEDVTTTIVVLRHAEKAVGGDDPPLSEAGAARAARIAEVFCAEGVRAAFATHYRRTQQTAEPCAEKAGIAVTADTLPKDFAAHAESLKTRILANPGGRVLIVGHSNTVPIVVHALTGVTVAPIDEHEYGRWFEITIGPDGSGRLHERRY